MAYSDKKEGRIQLHLYWKTKKDIRKKIHKGKREAQVFGRIGRDSRRKFKRNK